MNKQGISLRALAADSTEAVVDVIGVIGWEVGLQSIRSILASIPDTVQRVVFDIYSPGGDVWEGNGIIHEIGQMKQHTVARVQVAASMATLIAVACKERVMASNGRFLIHNAWTVTQGDADAHEKRAKELRDCEIEAAKFYAARTGKTSEEMTALMADERWLTAEEALSYGFATAINDPFKESDYEQVRQEITAAGKWPQALVDIPAPKQEEEVKDDEATDGAKVDAPVPPVVPEQPADEPDAVEAAYDKGRIDGMAQGQAKAVEDHAGAVEKLTGTVRAQAALIAKLQSEKDKAEAKAQAAEKSADERVKTIREQLESATARLSKFVDAAAAFSPAVETWDEAMRACGGDYEKAAKQYPELKKRYVAEHKAKERVR